jgi:hypothetical protein
MNKTQFAAPPGWAIRKYFGWVSAQGKTYSEADTVLENTAQQQFPGANWIVQFFTQQTPDATFASGIAVLAERIA